jgi:hypothetical protein
MTRRTTGLLQLGIQLFRASIYLLFGMVLLLMPEQQLNLSSGMRYGLASLCFAYGAFRFYRSLTDHRNKASSTSMDAAKQHDDENSETDHT